MFKFWECIHQIEFDPRVNRTYGAGQWCIQECLCLLIQRTIEIIEEEE